MKIGKVIRISCNAMRRRPSKVFIEANDGSGEYVLETRYEEAVKFQRGTEVCFLPGVGPNRRAYNVERLRSQEELIERFHQLKQQASILKALGEPTPELDRHIRKFSEDYHNRGVTR